MADRFLHFDNIDMETPYITSRCSECGKTFLPALDVTVEEAVTGIRRAFNEHVCSET